MRIRRKSGPILAAPSAQRAKRDSNSSVAAAAADWRGSNSERRRKGTRGDAWARMSARRATAFADSRAARQRLEHPPRRARQRRHAAARQSAARGKSRRASRIRAPRDSSSSIRLDERDASDGIAAAAAVRGARNRRDSASRFARRAGARASASAARRRHRSGPRCEDRETAPRASGPSSAGQARPHPPARGRRSSEGVLAASRGANRASEFERPRSPTRFRSGPTAGSGHCAAHGSRSRRTRRGYRDAHVRGDHAARYRR